MNEFVRWLAERQPADEERGQGLAEYALILALIAIVAILSLVFLGDTINDLMSYIGSTVSENT
ncbi:MAG: Flp family type IVb pilin [Candidatus Limnocylindrales bacterium]